MLRNSKVSLEQLKVLKVPFLVLLLNLSVIRIISRTLKSYSCVCVIRFYEPEMISSCLSIKYTINLVNY